MCMSLLLLLHYVHTPDMSSQQHHGGRRHLAPARRSRSADTEAVTQSSAVEATPEAVMDDSTTVPRPTIKSERTKPPVWVNSPSALLRHWAAIDERQRARLQGANRIIASDPAVADASDDADDEHRIGQRVLTEHRDRVRHAIVSYPSYLGLEWNLSLDEVQWVQEYCGQLVTGPGVLQALSNSAALSGARTVAELEPVAPPPKAASSSDDALAWVKRSLLTLTQHHMPAETHPVPDAPLGTQAQCGARAAHSDGIPIETVWEQLRHSTSIETGSAAIDRMLHGGLQCGFVTEVVGFAGVGKTCLMANWIAHAAIRGVLQDRHKAHTLRPTPAMPADPPNNSNDANTAAGDASLVLNGGGGCALCLVVPVGPNITARRVHHVVEDAVQNTPAYREALNVLRTQLDETSLTLEAEERIRFVPGVQSLDDLTQRVLPLLEVHMSKPNVLTTGWREPKRLLVIDSFATLVHCSLSSDPKESLHRHNVLAALMKRLKTLAEVYRYSIVLVTHATSYAAASSQKRWSTQAAQPKGAAADPLDEEDVELSDGDDDQQMGNHGASSSSSSTNTTASVSAFGNTFFHLVNNRVVLDSIAVSGEIKRVLRIIKSPVCPPVVFELCHDPLDSGISAPPTVLMRYELGDASLQEAADELRRSGVHGRGVFRMPNLKYLNQTSYMTPPLWRMY